MSRRIAMLANDSHPNARSSLEAAIDFFAQCGIEAVEIATQDDAQGAELIIVFGGDGTILYAAEFARPLSIPILGINYGHVGFLNEADPDELERVIEQVASGRWTAEDRMTIDIEVSYPDGNRERTWALNEAAVERATNSRMIGVDIGVDGRDVSSFKADTVVMSTATGSTAYNFSGGGPIVWPDVECMLLTPIAAHALFTRPLVVGPHSRLEVRIVDEDARLWCDGRRLLEAPPGSTITVVKGHYPVRLARLTNTPFSGRLVTKFQLPVHGWRG